MGMLDPEKLNSPEHRRAVDEELGRQLVERITPPLITGQVVACAMFSALYDAVDRTKLVIWFSAMTLLTLLRLAINLRWKRADAGPLDRKRLRIYELSTVFSGALWGSLILLHNPQNDLFLQLLVLVVVVAMPVAAVSSNAIRISVFHAFSVPIYGFLLYWTLFVSTQTEVYFALVTLAFALLLSSTAVSYHRHLRDSVSGRLINQVLVRELKETNSKLEELAYLDPLTHLGNRRLFERTAQRAVKRLEDDAHALALILIDIDKFKSVNDTYGHEAGDQLLIEIAGRINHWLSPTDDCVDSEVARLGGDEFVLLRRFAPDPLSIENEIARLVSALVEPMPLANTRFTPSVSIGVAFTHQHVEDVRSLLREADHAMYQAKKRSDQRFVIVNLDAMNETTRPD
jgi:diguanylate cyclase (GGDEF)-like protein